MRLGGYWQGAKNYIFLNCCLFKKLERKERFVLVDLKSFVFLYGDTEHI